MGLPQPHQVCGPSHFVFLITFASNLLDFVCFLDMLEEALHHSQIKEHAAACLERRWPGTEHLTTATLKVPQRRPPPCPRSRVQLSPRRREGGARIQATSLKWCGTTGQASHLEHHATHPTVDEDSGEAGPGELGASKSQQASVFLLTPWPDRRAGMSLWSLLSPHQGTSAHPGWLSLADGGPWL